MTTLAQGRALTFDEYDTLPEDTLVEYVDGHLLVSPGPTLQHQQVCTDLASALRAVLPVTHRSIAAWEWRTSSDAFIPDVMVFERSAVTDNRRFTGTPALCVEVLSTNRRDDLLLKMTKYAAAGLPHYWIVDPREGTLTTYVLDEDAFRPTQVLRARDGVTSLDLGVATLDLDVAALLAD